VVTTAPVAPQIRTRHGFVWSSRALLLWLQLDIEPKPRLDSTVRLVVPPPLSSLEQEIFVPFITEYIPALEEEPVCGAYRRERHRTE
jgi:hypothetical protein